mmetsp:Transcript_29188/g.73266  ORF Transcript_29188/g.73266 Transcript_29188/m.73266 type:complete len:118 (+) Transcript_29188:2-355(+)
MNFVEMPELEWEWGYYYFKSVMFCVFLTSVLSILLFSSGCLSWMCCVRVASCCGRRRRSKRHRPAHSDGNEGSSTCCCCLVGGSSSSNSSESEDFKGNVLPTSDEIGMKLSSASDKE